MVKQALTLCVTLAIAGCTYAKFPVSNHNSKLGSDNIVTLEEKTVLNLDGLGLNVGDSMPSMVLATSSLGEFDTTDSKGKIRIYSVLTSVDTPVCVQQAQELSEFISENPELSKRIEFIAISSDTPFAQQRFIKQHNLNERLLFVSDSKKHEFGYKTGSLIQELGLLSRTIIVVDADNTVTYIQRVPELTTIPNLLSAVAVAKQA